LENEVVGRFVEETKNKEKPLNGNGLPVHWGNKQKGGRKRVG